MNKVTIKDILVYIQARYTLQVLIDINHLKYSNNIVFAILCYISSVWWVPYIMN